MPSSPRLIDTAIPRAPEGVVLILHGGGHRGVPTQVSPTQLSVIRMIPIAHRIARAGRRRLAVLRLLNSYRGWDTEHTPVEDVRWALAEIARRWGPAMPVGLVGHSLGGRAALLCAGEQQVRGVVALAPWVYPNDVPDGAQDTPIVIIHGDQDRVASPVRSRAVADALGSQTHVSYVTVAGGTHAMLRRRDQFDGLAARCAVWMLLGAGDDPLIPSIVEGSQSLTV